MVQQLLSIYARRCPYKPLRLPRNFLQVNRTFHSITNMNRAVRSVVVSRTRWTVSRFLRQTGPEGPIMAACTAGRDDWWGSGDNEAIVAQPFVGAAAHVSKRRVAQGPYRPLRRPPDF